MVFLYLIYPSVGSKNGLKGEVKVEVFAAPILVASAKPFHKRQAEDSFKVNVQIQL